jgi:hypothetical protein
VTAGKDPMIGRALDLLVPEFDDAPDGLLFAAQTGATRLRAVRRRRQTVAVVAFAALLLFAGAAVAAKKYDLLPFLHTSDRNSARFSVSPSRTYHGAAALALTCPGANGRGGFVCHVSSPLAGDTRNYELGMRTDKVPLLTRQSMLASLEHAQGVDPAQVAKVRSDLAGVGDDFIRALAILARIDTVSGGSGSSGPTGTERVPPRGVPAWAACHEVTLATFRCRPLAALRGVASGTPLYRLQPSRDWRRVKAPDSQPSDFGLVLERLLGRKPTAAETRFFIDFATVAANAVGGPTGPTGGTRIIGVSNAHGAALLAARSLGVRTRNVSALAQPLPHKLPGGLTRVGTRLYRVAFDLRAERRTLYVYVNRSARLHVWRVVWVATKP